MYFTQDQPFGGPTEAMYPQASPLATQFMTGGSMEYMPSAQFLTSSQYGAFRTTPAYAPHSQMVGQPSLWQTYLAANRGRFPGSKSDYFFDSYLPHARQLEYQATAQRRWADSMTAFGATGTDFLGSVGAGALGGMAFGPLGAFAGSMLMPSIGAPYLDRLRHSRGLQQMSMSKIIGGPDVSTGLNKGFSLSAASDIDQFVRAQARENRIYKEDDYRKIMQLGTEAGVYDFGGDSNHFKRVTEKLGKGLHRITEALDGLDLKGTLEDIKRLQRMGMEIDQILPMYSRESMYSRMTGLNHQQMVDTYGQQGALSYSQMGLTAYQGSQQAMYSAASTEAAKRLGIINEAELSRMGGVSGAAQRDTVNTGTMMNNLLGVTLPGLMKQGSDFQEVDTDQLKGLLTGNRSTQDLINSTNATLAGSPEDIVKYQANADEAKRKFLDQLSPEGQELLLYRRALELGQQFGFKDERTQAVAGYRILSGNQMSMQDARLKADKMGNSDYRDLITNQLEQQMTQDKLSDFNRRQEERTITHTMGRAYDTAVYETFGRAYDNFMSASAMDKDYEENKKLGIYSTSAMGVGFGTRGYTTAQRAQLARLSPGTLRPGLITSRDSKREMLTTWDKLMGRSEDMITNAEEIVQGSTLSAEELGQGRDTLGKYVSSRGFSSFIKKFEDITDVSDYSLTSNLAETIRKSSPEPISTEESMRRAKQLLSDQNTKAFVLSAIGQSESVKTTFGDTLATRRESVTEDIMDQLHDRGKQIDRSLGELSAQNWMGLDDRADTNTIKKATRRFGGSLDAYAAVSFLNVGEGSDISDREIQAQIRQRAKALGIDDDKLQQALDSGLDSKSNITKLFRDQLSGKMDDEDISALFSAAEKKGATLDNAYDALNFGHRIDTAKRDAYAYQQQIYSLNVEDKLGGLFHGQDLTKALLNKSSIQEVLDRGNLSNKEQEYFQGLMGKVGSGGEIKSYQEAVEYLSPMLGDEATIRRTDDMVNTSATGTQQDIIAGFKDLGMERLPTTLDRVASSLDRAAAIGIQQIAMTEKLATTLSR